MDETKWLSSNQFAIEAEISPQAARKILRRASCGLSWRGHLLEVRPQFGRGGKAGERYELSLRSLSAALEQPTSTASEATSRAPVWRPTVVKNQGAQIGARYSAIEAALAFDKGTAGRAAAIKAEVAKSQHSERTLQRWIDLYEHHGMSGLCRKRPADAGKPRVIVSRAFDRAFRAAGYAEDLLAELGVIVNQRLKDIWASRAQAAGASDVGRRAEFELWKACQGRGVTLPEAAMRLSRRHVEHYVRYRHVDIFRNDAATFKKGLPRIERDRSGLQPMERVVADVKHLDVILQRPDGSEAWPKVVGFHDEATGRVFLYPLLLARGEGVRQEHVIEAFIAMVSDPAWGFPKGLYLDNGTEFACFEKIIPALSLMRERAGREIIYAIPYNASAKSVENSFKRLDTYLFSTLTGYAGGDRMWKKTQTDGKPPKPYLGSWDEFCLTLAGLLIGFNDRPLQRRDGNTSPNERFRAKVEAGWCPTTIDPLLIDAAFCDRVLHRIDRGVIRIGARRFHHERLHEIASRTKIVVALPWRRGGDPLFQLPDGTWIGAEEDHPYPADWAEGAKDAGRRKNRYHKGARKLAAETQPYDPVAASLERAALVRPVQIPGGGDRLGGSSELIAIKDGRDGASAAKVERLTDHDRERLREEAETQRLARKFKYG